MKKKHKDRFLINQIPNDEIKIKKKINFKKNQMLKDLV